QEFAARQQLGIPSPPLTSDPATARRPTRRRRRRPAGPATEGAPRAAIPRSSRVYPGGWRRLVVDLSDDIAC
uniref:Uncharacterized protein n=1 Tax=Oryza meridionalis TaxID=40149 RepID=A0A0E0EM21_9ORYZ